MMVYLFRRMKLIYHNKKNTTQVSPFDQALQQVSKNASPLYLASPYIGLQYLERILENTNEWKLLSDIEAWLTSGNRKQRAKCWRFILENLDRIRHVPDLHAKVAIGNNLLFLGSANFTNKGILGRDELSILINDPQIVNESLEWFDSLWTAAKSPVIDEGDELVKTLNEVQWTVPKSRLRLTSSSIKVKAVLDKTNPEGFDIARSFAKFGVSESDKLLPIEEAYQKISDEWFSSERTFTFKELLTAVSRINPTTEAKSIWSLVTHETVNHWSGGLFGDGFDRYIYEDNKFKKWDKINLEPIKRLDRFLEFIIKNIEVYPKTSYLPLESKWMKAGVPEHHVLTLSEQLIDIGLLIEIDNPGELEMYSIDQGFEWPNRWRRFTQAHQSFKNKTIYIANIDDSDFDDDINLTSSAESEFSFALAATQEAISVTKRVSRKNNSPKFSTINKELSTALIRYGLSRSELVKIREDALISAFNYYFDKKISFMKSDIHFIRDKFLDKHLSSLIKYELSNLKTGMFSKNAQGFIVLNPDWDGETLLYLYPKALQKWKVLLDK